METSPTDVTLLAEFARTRDGLAFQELVKRCLPMVVGIALRKTGNPEASNEIAQNTFSILARKAATLPSDIVLGGWIHRVATIEAADFNRKEYRRRKAMKEFKEASDFERANPGTDAFAELLHDLDSAMAALSAAILAGEIVIFDKAYVDFGHLFQLA